MKISWTVLFLFLSNVLMGQNGDCLTAIQICKKDTLKIDSIKGFGLNNTEVGSTQATCFSMFQNISSIETNSLWIKWQVAAAGTLSFTINRFCRFSLTQ